MCRLTLCVVLALLPLGARADDVAEDVRSELRWVDHAVTPEMAVAAGRRFPEGELFTYVFYGLALANVAEATHAPADVDRALEKGAWLLARIDASLAHGSYRRRRGLPARGGITWLGGRNLLLARLVRLAPARASATQVAELRRDSATLRSVFLAEPSGVPETLRGKRWPVDALFALESLQLHDALYGGSAGRAALARWRATMEAGLDAKTGLMRSVVDANGRAHDVPRGCALSWSLAVLPRLDPSFAESQWRAYKATFLRTHLGLPAFREYPPGIERKGDIDSGPIVGGIGMSATAFGLAAARANGDRALAARLEALGDLIGMPIVDGQGKRYVGGREPFFDVLALWTKTVPFPPAVR